MSGDIVSGIEKLLRRKKSNKSKEQLAQKEMNNLPIKSFDEFIQGNYMGVVPKSFVRCQGYYLMDMFHEIRNHPDTNYVTCMDDMIKDPDTTEDLFSRASVSCILKEFSGKDDADSASNELIGSRLADLFGVKTDYVAPIRHNPNKVLAVDFLSGDEQMETLRDMIKKVVPFYKFKDNSAPIVESLTEMTKALEVKIPDSAHKAQQIHKIQIDFIRMYMFKKYIIGDRDIATLNVGFIHTGDYSDLRLAPSFDYEAALDNIHTITGIEEDMMYLCREYPEHMKVIIKDFSLNGKRDAIHSIINKFSPEHRAVNSINIVENMLLNIHGYYNRYKDIHNPESQSM